MNRARFTLITSSLLLATFLAAPSRAAEIWLEAGVNAVGEPFLADVYVQNASDVYGLALDVVYSSATRSVLDADGSAANGVQPVLVEGDALSEGGAKPTFLEGGLHDGRPGRLVLGHTRVGDVGGVDLTMPSLLLSFWLTRDDPTSGNLRIENLRLEDAAGNPVATNLLPTWTYRTSGTVIVDATPDAASWAFVDSEGDITNGTGDRTLEGVPGGNATVTWNALANYDVPATATAKLVVHNTTTTFEGVYKRHVGTVAIDVAPENASWSLLDGDGGLTTGTGDQTVTGVPTGEIAVTWNPIAGFTLPAASTPLTLEKDGTLEILGLYMQPGKGAVAVAVTPETASWSFKDGAGADYSGTGGNVITAIEPGMIVLTWGELDNFETPTPNVASQSLAAGALVTFAGAYKPYFGTVEVAVTPDSAAWSFTDGAGGLHEGIGDETLHDIPVGDITLTWKALANHDMPTTGPVTQALARNGATVFVGLYERHSGVLAIDATPEAAPWSLSGPDGLALSDSGSTTLLAAPTGDYGIAWNPLAGWDSPVPATATLTLMRDETATFTAVYQRQLGTVFVDATPDTAPWSLLDSDGGLTTGTGDRTIVDVPTGDVTLTWSAIDNFDPPSPNPNVQTLASGMSATFTGVYARWTGTVQIDATPDTAAWFFQAGDGSVHTGVGDQTLAGIPSGAITLTWGNLPGFDTPTPNPVTQSLGKDATASFVGSYEKHVGTIVVNATPETATWLLSGPNGFSLSDAGTTTILAAAIGNYTIAWQPLVGWNSPDPTTQTLVVARNAVTTFAGVYTRGSGSVIIQVTPDAASWSLLDSDGGVTTGTGDATLSEAPLGALTLTWSPLAGYDAPEPNPTTQTLSEGANVTFTGVYLRQTGSVAIDVSPEAAGWHLVGPQGFSLSDTGSTTVLGLVLGDYTIVWQPLEGWSAPDPTSQTQAVLKDRVTTFSGVYRFNTGTVEVNVTPDSAAWSFIDSIGSEYQGVGDRITDGVPTGVVTLTWEALEGYDAPSPIRTSQTLALDARVVFDGVYVRQTGTLAIEVEPQAAAWSLVGPDGLRIDSTGTTTLLATPTGDYAFEWLPLTGYSRPEPATQTLTLAQGATVTVTGVYVRQTGTVTISVTPTSASWTLTDGDGQATGGAGNQTLTDVPTGDVALTWDPLAGYAEPKENPVRRTLTAGGSVTIEGVYEPLNLLPDAPAEPDPADAATDVPTTTALAWADAERATSYDVFLWKNGATQPTEPTASDLAAPGFQPPTSLQFGWIYNWQVLAKNATGSLFGPIWSFLTVDVADARDLVTHFYVVVLGRDPEPGAVDAWDTGYFQAAVRDRIDVRFVFREMGRLFFLSQEYDGRERSNAEFITDCYEAFLLRTPSAGELQPWLDDVTTPSGEVRWNRAEVMTQFAESQEFENLIQSVFPGEEYRGDPARNFTTTMFIGVFDRISDTGGLEYFSGRMEAAEDKLAEAKKIALEFFLSEEGAAKAPTNEQKVIRLYRAFLGRFPADSEIAFWTGELDSERETLESLIEKFGDSGEFAAILDAYFKSPSDELTVLLSGNVPLVLVRIPAGSFEMGSPLTEQDRESDEGPVHTVNIGYDFYMGKYEVTKRQWQAVMGTAPWSGLWGILDDLDSPAVLVSWNDAQSFLTALDAHITATGQGPATLRLPSEAEWEYACRAGTQARFYWGDDPSYSDIGDYAWWDGNADAVDEDYEHVVGRKLPSARGLYDMSGNVCEWCQDDWHGTYSSDPPTNGSVWGDGSGPYRVMRGGYWSLDAQYCRSASRTPYAPDFRSGSTGFRLAVVR